MNDCMYPNDASVYLGNCLIAKNPGWELSWRVYRKTWELADLLGEVAYLVKTETGEIIRSSDNEHDDEDYYPEPDEDYGPNI